MESRGLRVNLAKTKVTISDVSQGPTFTSDKHPCGVCCKGVGFNSIICNDCANWAHKQCSVLSNSLDNVVSFKCRTCLNPPVTNDDDKKVEIDNVDYEVTDQLWYLGDIIIAGGGT